MSQNSSVSHVKKKISKIFNWTQEENSEFCQSPAKRNEIQWLVTHTQKKTSNFSIDHKKKKKLAKFVKWSWKKHLISLMGCMEKNMQFCQSVTEKKSENSSNDHRKISRKSSIGHRKKLRISFSSWRSCEISQMIMENIASQLREKNPKFYSIIRFCI